MCKAHHIPVPFYQNIYYNYTTMKIIKRYRALKSYKLCISATIRDRHVSIEFGGADRYREVMGSYSTRDEKIQKFLEESPMFNREYELESSRVLSDYVKKNRDGSVEKPEMKSATFKTLNDAKAFIITTLGLKASQYNSKQKCIDICREHGYEIEFESR